MSTPDTAIGAGETAQMNEAVLNTIINQLTETLPVIDAYTVKNTQKDSPDDPDHIIRAVVETETDQNYVETQLHNIPSPTFIDVVVQDS